MRLLLSLILLLTNYSQAYSDGFEPVSTVEFAIPEEFNEPSVIKFAFADGVELESKITRLDESILMFADPKLVKSPYFISFSGFQISSDDFAVKFQNFEEHAVVVKPLEDRPISITQDNSGYLLMELKNLDLEKTKITLLIDTFEEKLTKEQAKNRFSNGYFLPLDQYDFLKVKKISVGNGMSCVQTFMDQIKCWGINFYGNLGYGDTTARGLTTQTMGNALKFVNHNLTKIEGMIVNSISACVFGNGQSLCWGYNGNGELGLGHTNNIGDNSNEMGASLVKHNYGSDKLAKFFPAGHSTCAVFENGKIKCWGYGGDGKLGQGSTNTIGDQQSETVDKLPYVDLGTTEKVIQIDMNYYHSCALFANGRVKCWGSASLGQLGSENTTYLGDNANEMGANLKFVNLGSDGNKVKQLALGLDSTCALFEDSRIKCWGTNGGGQLGLGDTVQRGQSANTMGDNLKYIELGMGPLKKITPGAEHYCALSESGLVKCWGRNNSGQLGLGDLDARGDEPDELDDKLPTIDFGGYKVLDLSTAPSSYYSCVLLENHRVKCWGYNAQGELGLGDTISRGSQENQMGEMLPFVDIGGEAFANE